MGRRKIEIQPLTDDRNRTVTFVKRKAGLFKKAHELSVLCQVDIAVIIMGNNNRVYEFSSVDTKELILAYGKVPRLQEAKGPENYGKYKKKKHLTLNNGKFSNVIDDEESIGDEDDLEYDSDTPDPKRTKRSYDAMKGSGSITSANNKSNNSASPSKNQFIKRPPPSHISLNNVPTFSEATHQSQAQQVQQAQAQPLIDSSVPPMRPVLRVQIPIDAKANSNDSATTITALETSMNKKNSNKDDNSNNSSTNKSNNNSNSNDENNSVDENVPNGANGKKDSITNISINTKLSLLSIPNGKSDKLVSPTNAPNITQKYSNFGPFKSPVSRKPMLPFPISKSLTSSPLSATAPQLPLNGNLQTLYGNLPQASPTSQYALPQYQQYLQQQQQPHQQLHQSQLYNYNNNNNNPGAVNNNNGNVNSNIPGQDPNTPNPYKNRPPLLTGASQIMHTNGTANNNPANPGEQTPISGLPSRYVDMFPSPSAFYGSQEWPTTAVGFTPLHNSMPQYFGSIPSARPGAGGWPMPQPPGQAPPQGPTQPSSATQPPAAPPPPEPKKE